MTYRNELEARVARVEAENKDLKDKLRLLANSSSTTPPPPLVHHPTSSSPLLQAASYLPDFQRKQKTKKGFASDWSLWAQFWMLLLSAGVLGQVMAFLFVSLVLGGTWTWPTLIGFMVCCVVFGILCAWANSLGK